MGGNGENERGKTPGFPTWLFGGKVEWKAVLAEAEKLFNAMDAAVLETIVEGLKSWLAVSAAATATSENGMKVDASTTDTILNGKSLTVLVPADGVGDVATYFLAKLLAAILEKPMSEGGVCVSVFEQCILHGGTPTEAINTLADSLLFHGVQIGILAGLSIAGKSHPGMAKAAQLVQETLRNI